MTYVGPVAEQKFVLQTIAGIEELASLPAFSDFDLPLVESILEEGGRFAADVFGPLNRVGDIQGVHFKKGVVQHPDGFDPAFKLYVESGWQSLSSASEWGGQNLPLCLSVAFNEQLASANMACSLCMLLTAGAVEAIEAYGNEALKKLYLPNLVSGRWTGTMNLTEPQAGSDVGALRTIATPSDDGSWRIKGSKIFITWGEHELAENIIHLVLARTPGAPPGTKGISLFLVPKYLPDAHGECKVRNDVRCVSVENKLGIHASPTCTMSFGDEENCVGWLIGEINAGMRAMFAMMNSARLNIGLEGVAIAERAYQGAVAYARERVQSAPVGGGESVRIIEHPDVRRMLLQMRAITQGIRAIAYLNAAAIDRSRGAEDEGERRRARGLADLLTPITKAYATDMGVEVASLGIQVFGGMGFIEETGAAQHYRDIRIAPIYEGTNGIQALDLVSRKLTAAGGEHSRRLLSEILAFCHEKDHSLLARSLRDQLRASACGLSDAVERVVKLPAIDAAAVATPLLRCFGVVLAAYLLARQTVEAKRLILAGQGNRPFLDAKISTATFFITSLLPEANALCETIMTGTAEDLFALSDEQFST